MPQFIPLGDYGRKGPHTLEDYNDPKIIKDGFERMLDRTLFLDLDDRNEDNIQKILDFAEKRARFGNFIIAVSRNGEEIDEFMCIDQRYAKISALTNELMMNDPAEIEKNLEEHPEYFLCKGDLHTKADITAQSILDTVRHEPFTGKRNLNIVEYKKLREEAERSESFDEER